MSSDDEFRIIEVPFTKPPPEFEYNSWYAITLSTIIWIASYNLTRYYLPSKSIEFCNRIFSFIHGLITAFMGINQCFVIDVPFQHPEWRTTQSQRFLMVCSLGYFIHDTLWLLIYDRKGKVMLAHHTFSTVALYRMLYMERSGAQATCSLGCMEITNPMIQIRWFLRSAGFYPSSWYTSVEIMFLVLFVLVRIILGTYFLVVIVFQSNNDWEFRVFAVMIYTISWIFLINMLKYFVVKYGLGRKDELHHKGT